MPELKPCPFCGKDAQIEPDEIGSGGQHVPPYHAGCIRGAGCGIAFTADNPDEAIAEWNRRALSTVTPADVGGQDVTQPLDDLHVGSDGACDWSDIANARDEVRHLHATALEAKEAELAGANADRDRWYESSFRSTQRAEAALAEARKALEPFAEAAGDLDENAQDQHDLWENPAAMNITIGHLRAARRVREGGKS